MPIFHVKSVKIYTGQKKFTRAPLVVLVTNMRYGKVDSMKIDWNWETCAYESLVGKDFELYRLFWLNFPPL